MLHYKNKGTMVHHGRKFMKGLVDKNYNGYFCTKTTMKTFLYYIQGYPFSCLTILVIWVICLIPIPETPLDNVAFMDKWTHLVMYGGLCLIIWLEYIRKHNKANHAKVFMLTWLAPVAMSGLIELAQAYCTNGNRSGDWMDFAANAGGATLGYITGRLLARILSTWKKDT